MAKGKRSTKKEREVALCSFCGGFTSPANVDYPCRACSEHHAQGDKAHHADHGFFGTLHYLDP